MFRARPKEGNHDSFPHRGAVREVIASDRLILLSRLFGAPTVGSGSPVITPEEAANISSQLGGRRCCKPPDGPRDPLWPLTQLVIALGPILHQVVVVAKVRSLDDDEKCGAAAGTP